jgi:exodeoxyribonuclease VII small subunit
MARRKNETQEVNETDTFENSLAKLEGIVEAMESSQLPLEDLVKHYEEGSVLLRKCDTFLSSARERIELITLHAASPHESPKASPTSASAPVEDNDDDDDIRLF